MWCVCGALAVAACGTSRVVISGAPASTPIGSEIDAATATTPWSTDDSAKQTIISDKINEERKMQSTTTTTIEWPTPGIHPAIDAPASSQQFLSTCMVFVLHDGLAYTMYVGSAGRDAPHQGAVLLLVQSAVDGKDDHAVILKSPTATGELACERMDGDVLVAVSTSGVAYLADPIAGTIVAAK